MKFAIVAIKDAKADVFSHPMAFQSKGQAIRSFADQVNTEGEHFYKHPEDYSLWLVGEYDDNTATLIPTASGAPEHMGQAVMFAVRHEVTHWERPAADPRQLDAPLANNEIPMGRRRNG